MRKPLTTGYPRIETVMDTGPRACFPIPTRFRADRGGANLFRAQPEVFVRGYPGRRPARVQKLAYPVCCLRGRGYSPEVDQTGQVFVTSNQRLHRYEAALRSAPGVRPKCFLIALLNDESEEYPVASAITAMDWRVFCNIIFARKSRV